MQKQFKFGLKTLLIFFILFLIVNAIRIYKYSKIYTQIDADVAIVLGAGTNKGKLSPVFKERVNHSILLYQMKQVKAIIFTGGYGNNQTISDSQVAKEYAINKGILLKDIFIEEKSKYTIENLKQAKLIMDSLSFKTALIVSDPLHMKRAISLATNINIESYPSPTQTSKYKSRKSKVVFLLRETLFFTMREIIGKN